MYRLANLYFLHKSNVSSKSASVSVGKPQIMSVRIFISGTLKLQILVNFANKFQLLKNTLIVGNLLDPQNQIGSILASYQLGHHH